MPEAKLAKVKVVKGSLATGKVFRWLDGSGEIEVGAKAVTLDETVSVRGYIDRGFLDLYSETKPEPEAKK